MKFKVWIHIKTCVSWKRRQLHFWNKLFSVQKIPTSNLKLSIDGKWFEHLATAQKQLLIRNETINIVNVDNLSRFYHIKPSFLVMGGLVCEWIKTIYLIFLKMLCAPVLSGCFKQKLKLRRIKTSSLYVAKTPRVFLKSL